MESARGLLLIAAVLTLVQVGVTGVDLGLHPPHVSSEDTCAPGHDTWQWSVATYTWLLLALVSVGTCVVPAWSACRFKGQAKEKIFTIIKS